MRLSDTYSAYIFDNRTKSDTRDQSSYYRFGKQANYNIIVHHDSTRHLISSPPFGLMRCDVDLGIAVGSEYRSSMSMSTEHLCQLLPLHTLIHVERSSERVEF